LWANYGDTIKARVFAPQVVGAGSYDAEGNKGEIFALDFLEWKNTTLHLNLTKPKNELLQVDFKTPQSWSYDWTDDLLKITAQSIDRVTIIAWSI